MKSKSSADSLATLFDFDFSLRGTETESNPISSRKTRGFIPIPPTITTNSHSHRHIKTLFAVNAKPNAEQTEMNKIFASVWLDSERVLVGTKCNRLIVLDVAKGRIASEIPPITGYWEGNLFVEGCTPAENFSGTLQHSATSPCAGIHSIAVNPSKTLLAVAAGAPLAPIQIYTLPHLAAYAVLRRPHNDMVFSVEFYSDFLLVSGGRDTRLCLWNLADPNRVSGVLRGACNIDVSVIDPVPGEFNESLNKSTSVLSVAYLGRLFAGVFPRVGASASDQQQHATVTSSEISIQPQHGVVGVVKVEEKIRDLKVINGSAADAKVAALTTHGVVKLFDIYQHSYSSPVSEYNHLGFNPKSADVTLYNRKETVCLQVSENSGIIVVGSQSYISLIDPRQRELVTSIKSMDVDWGVRSLAFDAQGRLTVGGGMGRISFLDMRMHEYLACAVRPNGKKDELAQKWLNMDADGRFSSRFNRDAIYTLAYCPFGVRLFAGGGPLQLSLKGCYAGIWE
ncbi:DDB1- and CUL4-associated factor 12 [Physocladia obscura]|uniref:DDB1- and CUL4-associated factor 12 n=1 Tax=Physocladia obscura TaxID=109957 RepID=A0AAD5T6H3_9FUNG|nr:DDB1- and CUL4-associated factor 12 [Physocladia obscura]